MVSIVEQAEQPVSQIATKLAPVVDAKQPAEAGVKEAYLNALSKMGIGTNDPIDAANIRFAKEEQQIPIPQFNSALIASIQNKLNMPNLADEEKVEMQKALNILDGTIHQKCDIDSVTNRVTADRTTHSQGYVNSPKEVLLSLAEWIPLAGGAVALGNGVHGGAVVTELGLKIHNEMEKCEYRNSLPPKQQQKTSLPAQNARN